MNWEEELGMKIPNRPCKQKSCVSTVPVCYSANITILAKNARFFVYLRKSNESILLAKADNKPQAIEAAKKVIQAALDQIDRL